MVLRAGCLLAGGGKDIYKELVIFTAIVGNDSEHYWAVYGNDFFNGQ